MIRTATLSPIESPQVELDVLIGLFFQDRSRLGNFVETLAQGLTPVSRSLLDHNKHMTVTVEKHHGCAVDVKVLEDRVEGNHYLRKILLTRQSDGKVVQFGIVRLDMTTLSDETQSEIRQKETPLGRILIRRDVMRDVKLAKLYRISSGPELASVFDVDEETVFFGRTAWIFCNGSPAIELLEIVCE